MTKKTFTPNYVVAVSQEINCDVITLVNGIVLVIGDANGILEADMYSDYNDLVDGIQPIRVLKLER